MDGQKEQNKTKSVLPETCWINAIEWDLDKEIENTLPYYVPENCPQDETCVPPRL